MQNFQQVILLKCLFIESFVSYLNFPVNIDNLQSKTDILVGVKAEIGEPAFGRPDCGRIEFFVNW